MVHPLWPAQLSSYAQSGLTEVKGWVDPAVLGSLAAIHRCQQTVGVSGGIGEIGVYQGKFFLALDALRQPGELSAAFDIFDDQVLNIDGSGSGTSLRTFLENVSRHSTDPEKVVYRECDSFTLTAQDVRSLIQGGTFRLFSVDGGHTVEHTINDLKLAADVIGPGGVIILDDYYNPMWPGVHEGFVRFMTLMNYKLAPFAYHANKLFLTSISHHDFFLDTYTQLMGEMSYKSKPVRMSGFAVLAVSK